MCSLLYSVWFPKIKSKSTYCKGIGTITLIECFLFYISLIIVTVVSLFDCIIILNTFIKV